MSGIQAWDDTPSMEEQFGETPAMPIEELKPNDLRDRSKALYQQLGRDGMPRQNDPVETIASFALSVWQQGFSEGYNSDAYQEGYDDGDQSGTHAGSRHKDNHPTPTAADTGLVERLTAENERLREQDDPAFTWVFKVRAEAAEQREAAAREQIGKLEISRSAWEDSARINKGRADEAEDTLTAAREQIAALREALNEAELQIIYLHDKFKETGSGNAVLARIRAALAKETSDGQ